MHKQEEKLSTLLKSMGYIDRGSIYSGWLTSLKLGTQMTEMIGEIKEKEEMNKSGLLNVDKREVQMTNLDEREVESQLCKEGMVLDPMRRLQRTKEKGALSSHGLIKPIIMQPIGTTRTFPLPIR